LTWPGNVRLLENIVKRQLILPDGDIVSELRGKTKQALVQSPASLQEIGSRAAEEAEQNVVLAMLEQTGWNQKESARRLHISYKAFRNRLKRWQLSRESPNRWQEYKSQPSETFSSVLVSPE